MTETPTAADYEAQLALCRNLYDELFAQTEQLRAERQEAIDAATALSCDVTRLGEQRQQAIDALRDIANHNSALTPETIAAAALLELEEKP